MTQEQIKQKLENFKSVGKTFYLEHGIRYSEGVYFLMEVCHCSWLLEFIVENQQIEEYKNMLFIIYDLQINKDKTAMLEITDEDRNLIEKYEFTDIQSPLDEIEIWCVRKTLQLPSEYWG